LSARCVLAFSLSLSLSLSFSLSLCHFLGEPSCSRYCRGSSARDCRPPFCSAKTVWEEGKAKGGENDFEIFVAVHKFEGGGRAYLNTDRAFPASGSSSWSSYSYSSSSSSPLLLVLGSCCRCWILPHLFYPSSFFFFIFLFFFSGLDLHCLASANKLSRGPPYVDPIVIIIVLLARTGNERNSPSLSFSSYVHYGVWIFYPNAFYFFPVMNDQPFLKASSVIIPITL